VNRTLPLAVLCAAVSAYSVLQSLVVPALATLQRELHTGTVSAGWIFTTYLLAASVLTPLIGRLGDVLGRTRALIGSLVVLGAGAVVSALATTLPVMLAGRVVQGAGGAVFPLAFALVRDVVPADRRATVIATISAALSVTGALGTVSAGVILGVLDYHWLFWLPAVVTFATAAVAGLVLPRSPVPTGPRAPIGWGGAALLSGWLTPLLLAFTELPRSGIRAFAGIAGTVVAAVPPDQTGGPLSTLTAAGYRPGDAARTPTGDAAPIGLLDQIS
jgi:MFS family permease